MSDRSEPDDEYSLVPLRGGAFSVRARSYAETMHPGVGPEAEAEALYVRQTGLIERLQRHEGEFVIWDIGLGAAANALTVLRRVEQVARPLQLRMFSFDDTTGPLAFALQHAAELPYLSGYESTVATLVERRAVTLERGRQEVRWELGLGDFPTLLTSETAASWPRPHLILFDPFSPARNPAMWTRSVFGHLFSRLDPQRPCLLSTYSRSTATRVALLLAGFWVGAGLATGLKEETTVAANVPDLIASPLDQRWLERARRSDSAEPLIDSVYRKAPLTTETWSRLQGHPQFQRG